MALAKRCDRCGILYEPYPIENAPSNLSNLNGTKGIRLTKDTEILYEPRARANNSGVVQVENKRIDLCPKCLDSFDYWLKRKFEPVFTINENELIVGMNYKEEQQQ